MTVRQLALRNVIRGIRTYAAYFLCSAFSVMIFFVNAMLIFHPDIRSGLSSETAVQAFVVAECMIFVFSFLFVLYSVSSFLTSRKKEFGIFMLHGMTLAQLGKMIFLENMIIGLLSIIFGTFAGTLFAKLFFMASAKALEIASLPFYLSPSSLLLTIGAFVLLFLLISAYTSRMVRTSKLIELFQAMPRREKAPHASPVLSALSLVLLTIGYIFAVTADTFTIYDRVVPVVVITTAGTYLLYSHLGVYCLQYFRKTRGRRMNGRHLLTLIGLSSRLKEQSRMFFAVTMLSTISFCSLGVFASINVVSGLFEEDYPAAVGYVSKTGNPYREEHLSEIRAELSERKLDYTEDQIKIKYASVQPSSEHVEIARNELPVISYADYKQAVLQAGFTLTEQGPGYNEAILMISSQNDRSKTRHWNKREYMLNEPQIAITEIGFTDHVIIPDNLLDDFDESFEAVIIHDALYQQIKQPARQDVYTGFYLDDFTQTAFVASDLADHGRTRYDAHKSYSISVSGTLYILRESMYRILLFIAMLLAAVFFIAAGSFLYFRLYADLDRDRKQYLTLMKLGLTDKEFKRMVTWQLATMFFLPTFVAVIHSIFAFIALQSLFYLSIATKMGVVLFSFMLAQVLYFFFIRFHYLRNLKKTLL
ncbi:ABC transporter permease [Paenibacillus urinalis]|uniref:ABC transporter permease n=1 Tax=Paenibacillus urinalis TaxID=521520 RepID=A0AAX3N4Q7_9BACL|nr:ABC transporter permease [Paenibacillus urinalis]WDH84710.1 ABC transporter permease [Paenibacillus urinalis]